MALRGLKMLFDQIINVQAVLNPNLKVLGMVATKYDSRPLNSKEIYDYMSQICERNGIKLFNQAIKVSVRFAEAPNLGKPLVLLNPTLDGAQAYQQIA
jgi:chromosome partitioning protein